MQPHQLSNQQQNNSIEISIVKLLILKPMPLSGGMPEGQEGYLLLLLVSYFFKRNLVLD